jgi:hypothetical protein
VLAPVCLLHIVLHYVFGSLSQCIAVIEHLFFSKVAHTKVIHHYLFVLLSAVSILVSYEDVCHSIYKQQ